MAGGPWGAGAWDTGSWGESSGDIVVLDGVSSSTELGQVSQGTFISVNVTGVSAEVQLGEEEGVAGNGWGANYWGFSGWGGVLSANVDVTGVEATATLGIVSEVIGQVNVVLTGVQGNTALGEDEVDGNANVVVSGVSANVSIGTVSVFGKANVEVTGVAGTVALGQVTQATSNTVMVTGVAGTIFQGSVAIKGNADVILTGVSASGQVGRPLVWGLIDTYQNSNFSGINTSQTPNWVPIAA